MLLAVHVYSKNNGLLIILFVNYSINLSTYEFCCLHFEGQLCWFPYRV